MRRRQYVGAVVAVGSGAIAGCGSLASLGGPSEPPDEVVEAFFEALDDGDRDEAEELLHSDGPTMIGYDEDWEQWEEADIEIADSEVVEQSNDEATVEVTYGYDTGADELASENTYRFFLRTEDGEWRLWDGENV